MVKSKNGKSLTIITLLTILLFTCQSKFLGVKVPAHDNVYVHPFMSNEAEKLLPEGSAMRLEIDEYMYEIEYGSINEDETDLVYEDLTGSSAITGMLNTHFWDADKGPTDLVQPYYLGFVPVTPELPNAYQKSIALFNMALEAASQDPPQLNWAYRHLGHVAHLIEDMTVPAHVHEDFHPPGPLPGGDDCFEDWYYESRIYTEINAQSALASGGLIEFPDEIEVQMRQGNWTAGLFYLMYTTNQHADYFASDDHDGDTNETKGWVDYSGWPSSPTTMEDLEDNDDGDHDEDGELSTIAMKSCVYGVRAVATLYKMFYETIHPPVAIIENIDYTDEDGDGKSDFRWVNLDLRYDVGASEYFRDLEARYGNWISGFEAGGIEWEPWESIGAYPDRHRKVWQLVDGDGTKTVYYQVRNLMGLTATDSYSIELVERGVPQLFEFTISGSGADSIHAQVDFYIDQLYVDKSSGDSDVEFYFDCHVRSGADTRLSSTKVFPSDDSYFIFDPPEYLNLHAVPDNKTGTRGLLGDIITSEIYDYSHIHSQTIQTLPAEVMLRVRGRDYDPWPNPDDPLKAVQTEKLSIGEATGTYERKGWYDLRPNGEVNEHYAIYARMVGTVEENPWEYSEGPHPGYVRYGGEKMYVQTAAKSARVGDTEYQGTVVRNTAVECEMRGPELWAWTTDAEPDMVVVGLSPVSLMITDPDGLTIGTRGVWEYLFGPDEWEYHSGIVPTFPQPMVAPLEGMLTVIEQDDEEAVLEGIQYVSESYNQIPKASYSWTDMDGDGDLDIVIVFDDRKVGDYQINVYRGPTLAGPYSKNTYSIGISTRYRKNADIQPYPTYPREFMFLVEDEQLPEISETYFIRSNDLGVKLPPRADAGGPYKTYEGIEIVFNANNSLDPDSHALTYRWDFDDDGIWDTDWSNLPTASYIWNDDWTGKVRVEVSDGTFYTNSTAIVTVSNALPVVNVGMNQLASPGDELQFTASFTDLGVDDTHMIVWDFGDGTTITGGLSHNHVYSESQKFIVNLTITDDDGGVGRDTLTVNSGVAISIDPILASAAVPPFWFIPRDYASYNVLVHHLGNDVDTYDIRIEGIESDWCSLSSTSVTLEPDQSKSVTLKVSPFYDADYDMYYGFTLKAVSQVDTNVFDQVDADILVEEAREHSWWLYIVLLLMILMVIIYLWRRYGPGS